MINKSIIKVGVVGVGRLGKFHVEQYQEIDCVDIVGFFDIDEENCIDVEKKYGLKKFAALENLLAESDVISIVTPTTSHFQIAQKALKSACHVFIEKPITETIKEAEELIELSKKQNRFIQVGHIERYNPAFEKIKKYSMNPLFIESHRLSPFHTRGIDVDVVLDLMIHDIDILLSIMNSKIKKISSYGISVLSETIDMANARIAFKNGSIANLTASRISQKKLRKFRIFENQSYTTIDFLNPSVEKYIVSNNKPKNELSYVLINENKEKYILYDKPKINSYNALKRELSDFLYSIRTSTVPTVDAHCGLNALDVALQITNQINSQNNL